MIPTASTVTVTATAITPEHLQTSKMKTAARSSGRLFFAAKFLDHNDPGADADAAIEIDHIFIAHPDAAG